MKAMMTDKAMKGMAESVETFITAIIDLEALFMGSYDGGSFCQGLVFGRAGSKMLLDIAQKFSTIPAGIDPANLRKPKEPKVKDRKERITSNFLKNDKTKH